MIGLLFLFVIGLWVWIAVKLGTKIPQWLGATRYRTAIGVVLVPLIFVAPVADEIIAYPQMRALCKQVTFFELAPGMDEKKAYGRTVYHKQSGTREMLWPPSVEILRWDIAYVDAATKEPILRVTRFEPLRGMLGVPNGSSGGQMTVVLGKGACGSRIEDYDSKGIPTRFSYLNLTNIPTP
jgi:hypothetical protein